MADPVVSFFVSGIPSPGGSKTAQVIRRKGGDIVMVKGRPLVTMRDAGGEKTKNWRANVAFFARQAYRGDPIDAPLRVEMAFVMPRIKGHYKSSGFLKGNAPKYHTSKPDALKLARSTEDALTAILWTDDSRTAHLTSSKIYGDRPGCLITIWLLDPSMPAIQIYDRPRAPELFHV
jgi:Holliday junction resolvase RusA-like endonuclease